MHHSLSPRVRALLFIVTSITVCTAYYLYDQQKALSPQPQPINFSQWQLTNEAGQSTPLQNWQGNTLLIHFWATWCPPCKREIPLLNAAQKHYGNERFTVIGIAIDDVEKVQQYRQQVPINYPSFIGQPGIATLAAQLGNTTGGLPYTAIVSPSGDVLFQHPGELTQKILEQALINALN